jgi:hypothetical protein
MKPRAHTLYSFWASVLDADEWSASQPGRFISGERTPRSHWVCTRAIVGPMEESSLLQSGIEPWHLSRTAQNQLWNEITGSENSENKYDSY